MATQKGVWNLQQVRDKQLQDLWSYASEGMLFVWGAGGFGNLAQNDQSQYQSPVQIPGSWSAYAGGGASSLMVSTSGELWAAGYNNKGQLGQNSTNPGYSSPVQIPGTTWASVVTVGQWYASLGTKTDGTLWSWGRNEENESRGVLGHNNQVSYSSPTQIPGTNWSSNTNHLATAGNGSVHAIKTDGTYWAWGYASAGQLGQNQGGAAYYSSPVQVPGTNWAYVGQRGANGTGGAVKTNGELWMWGYNDYGTLGQNNRTNYSSPVQVPGTTWSTINTGGRISIATKTDGTLWVWGSNTEGNLGQNESAPAFKSSPVQIPGTTWSAAITNAGGSYATKTDGTLWVWGDNNNYELGQSSGVRYSSPVQIPGDWDISKIRLSWQYASAAISAISS